MRILDTNTTEFIKNKLSLALDIENHLSATDFTKADALLTKLETSDRITATEEALIDKIIGTLSYCVLPDGRLNIGTKDSEDKALAKSFLDENSYSYTEDEVSFYISQEHTNNFDVIVIMLAKIIK